jgi:predicted nucleotidyltransferase component of viral defense system
MIEASELDEWAERLGVATAQIRHDHLVSHLLAAISFLSVSDVAFYGGTALCRTLLDGARVSEDVDLLHADPQAVLEALEGTVPQVLRREFPRAAFDAPTRIHDTWTTDLIAPEGLRLRVQVTRTSSTDPWEFAHADVSLRYSDLDASVRLPIPTPDTFVAMKGLAWHDRHAPRDLFDLAGLARGGHISRVAAELMHAKSSHGWITAEFERLPRSALRDWEAQLAHQVRMLPDPADLAREVLSAIEASELP